MNQESKNSKYFSIEEMELSSDYHVLMPSEIEIINKSHSQKERESRADLFFEGFANYAKKTSSFKKKDLENLIFLIERCNCLRTRMRAMTLLKANFSRNDLSEKHFSVLENSTKLYNTSTFNDQIRNYLGIGKTEKVLAELEVLA